MRRDKSLRGLGLKQLKSDPCVYTRLTSNCNLYLALYVDDGLILSDNQSETQKLIKGLKSKFKITLSSGEKYIGLEIDQAPDGSIVISQEAYVKEVLLRFNMQDCKPIGTPADPSNPLSADMSPRTDDERKEMEKIPYKQAVGALMFLACVSRLDIAFAMSVVTRFFADPGLKHWQAVKRILRNLQKAKKGYVFTHDDKTLSITEKETQKVVLMGDSRRTDGLFVLRLKTVHATANVASAPNLQVWHHRLSHTGKTEDPAHGEERLSSAGLEIGDKATDFDCTDCSAGSHDQDAVPRVKRQEVHPR